VSKEMHDFREDPSYPSRMSEVHHAQSMPLGDKPAIRSTTGPLRHSNTCPAYLDQGMDMICIGQSQWSLDEDVTLIPEVHHHCCQGRCRCVVLEKNPFRLAWNFVVLCLVLYIATIYLFRLAFIEFNIGSEDVKECTLSDLNCPGVGWFILDEVAEAVFIADLVLQFFFSFRDAQGVEVTDAYAIAKNYFGGLFFTNALACVPYEIFLAFESSEAIEDSAQSLKAAKMWRLLRVVRLLRLFKIGWLAQVVIDHSWNRRWRRVLHSRACRILSFLLCLLMMVHILACGWYIVAAFHEDVNRTWVGRRTVNETPLTGEPPAVQWLHSMYFIMSVCTTVGFGDVSAHTPAEMVYVILTMVIGIVTNGIVISGVQAILSTVNKSEAFVNEKMGLVEAFAVHTGLDPESTRRMGEWVKRCAGNWERNTYNREEVQTLITSRGMPGALLDHLSRNLFNERLCKNRFLLVCKSLGPVPQRLPLLLAAVVNKVDFLAEEVVYQMEDFPFTAFLVLGGTFAHIGIPAPGGGRDSVAVHAPRGQEQNYAFNPNLAMPLQGKTPKHKSQPRFPTFYDERSVASLRSDRLWPYQMFSAGSYFGEVELLMSRPRFATMRCESGHGTVLVLRKEAFMELAAEFPKFGVAWRRASLRHERQRQRLLAKLTQGHSHRYLAATRIQQVAKQRWGRSSERKATGGNQPAFDSAEFWGSRGPHSRIALPRLLASSGGGSPLRKKSHGAGAEESSATLWQQPDSCPRLESRDSSRTSPLDHQPSAQDYAHLCSSMDALRRDFAMLQRALLQGGVVAGQPSADAAHPAPLLPPLASCGPAPRVAASVQSELPSRSVRVGTP
jgi:CRP-like cAMP-binding protein